MTPLTAVVLASHDAGGSVAGAIILIALVVFAVVGVRKLMARKPGETPKSTGELFKAAQEKGSEAKKKAGKAAKRAAVEARRGSERAKEEATKAKERVERAKAAYRASATKPPVEKKPAPANRPPGWILAIDFGTSFTTAAVVNGTSDPVILDVDGASRMPSTIFLDEDHTLRAGKAAERLLDFDPTRGLRSPKAVLDGLVDEVVLGPRAISVVDIAAAVMGRAWAEAMRFTGGKEPERVVLTHPATWSKVGKERLVAAIRKVGATGPDESVQLVAEPVAAAVYYTGFRTPKGPVAVYDLGGGTFDTAVLLTKGKSLRLAGQPSGDARVGGNLFDELLFDWFLDQLPAGDPALTAAAPVTMVDQRLRAKISRRVTEAREILSDSESVHIILDDSSEPRAIKRTQLNVLIVGAVTRSVQSLRANLDGCGILPKDLEAVFLSGGASRTPLVVKLLRDEFGKAVVTRGDPKVAVCLGAAVTPSDFTVAGGPGGTSAVA